MRLFFLLCLSLFNLCKGVQENGAHQSCGDIRTQNKILINQLIGIWFGVEIISHKLDDPVETVTLDVCPIIYIEEMKDEIITETIYGTDITYEEDTESNPYRTTTELNKYYNRRWEEDTHNSGRLYKNWKQPQYAPGNRRYDLINGNRVRHMKRLKLEWNENGKRITYIVSYDNSKLGFWRSSAPQNGMTMDPHFNHFAGAIHVIKAVGGHLVLTFCHLMPERHLYTLILSRDPEGLKPWEVGSVHHLLLTEGLPVRKVKRVCRNGSARNDNCLLVGILALIGTALFQKHLLL
ncbi:uncharacterized protein LOC108745070 [Agrilus planipennis]|uniref:Uncharacterized protein LOC108745070 n=1 Tax=Agrilus planipennis TaxID=224129 RepID=A0A7F5RAJ8_AGRPL|nr:uncharacterized protein LOC108745070 [Agrilus planipennis]